jgi:NAD(P)-dependent dehydrogenase (short-subunit alcohol dehydrogenase family)
MSTLEAPDGGRRAIVTGVSSGIGLSLAQLLLNDGVQVFGIDRKACPLAEVNHICLDLSDLAAMAAAINEMTPPISAVANVAGIAGTNSADKVLITNLVSAIKLTKMLIPFMPAGSSVINISSISARTAGLSSSALTFLIEVETAKDLNRWLSTYELDGPAAYAVSKRAIVDWSTQLSVQLLGTSIRVNCVSPGPVETPILSDFTESMGSRTIERAARVVGRHAQPIEIANVIRFLLGTDSVWINGANLVVDGGLMAKLSCDRKLLGSRRANQQLPQTAD